MPKHTRTNPDNGWEIVVARDFEQIEAIREFWQTLQSRQSSPVPNADIDRYISVVKSSEEHVQPYVICFRHADLPRAVVVGRIEKHRFLCKIGYKVLCQPLIRCLTVVYGGILGELNEVTSERIIQELLQTLRRGEVDAVLLANLNTDLLLYRLARKMPTLLCREHFPIILNHRRMRLPENLEQFYKGCSKRHRGNLRRYIRTLEKEYPDQVRVVRCSSEQGLEDFVRDAARISHKTYQNAMGKGLIDNPKTFSLMETAAKHGWLRAHVLYINSEPCAFQIGLRYTGTYFLDQIGYDPEWRQYNVGTVLFLMVLEELCVDPDIEALDFGFGDADYKQQYGDECWSEAYLHVFSSRAYPVCINILQFLIASLSLSARFLADKMNFTTLLKRGWRGRLQKKTQNKQGTVGK